MDKKRNYAVLGIGFVFACLIAPVISLTLIGPYIGGLFAVSPDGCGSTKSHPIPSMHLICPLTLWGNKNKTITVSVTNPSNNTYEYLVDVDTGSLDNVSDRNIVCSDNLIVVSPQQTESFTCELNPKSLDKPVTWIYAYVRVEDHRCEYINAVCGVQPLNWLYFLLPFVVAAPFIWLHFKVNDGIRLD